MADGRAVPRNVSGLCLETGETASRPILFDLCQRIPADEVSFSKLDRPAEPRFVRVDRLVHVVSIKAQGSLEPGRVPRTQARGQHTFALAFGEDRVPRLTDPPSLDEELQSILSRVSGARDERGHAGDLARSKCEIGNVTCR